MILKIYEHNRLDNEFRKQAVINAILVISLSNLEVNYLVSNEYEMTIE